MSEDGIPASPSAARSQRGGWQPRTMTPPRTSSGTWSTAPGDAGGTGDQASAPSPLGKQQSWFKSQQQQQEGSPSSFRGSIRAGHYFAQGDDSEAGSAPAFPGTADGPDDEAYTAEGVFMRPGHSTLRTGPASRIQRQSSHDAAARSAEQQHRQRRRWAEGRDADEEAGGGGGGHRGGGAASAPPASTALGVAPGGGSTGQVVRMKRSEAWAKFLAYEACCQVCMMEGARGTQQAFYFLGSGCQPLRHGLGIEGLLLPQVMAAHLAGSIGSGETLELGNEIVWDDTDVGDHKLGAGAFLNCMNTLKVRVVRLQLPQRGLWSKLSCKRTINLATTTVAVRAPHPTPAYAGGPLGPVELRFRLGPGGAALPGSPVVEMQPEGNVTGELVLDVTDGIGVLARGSISCKRVWQLGMEHATLQGGGLDPLADGADGRWKDEDGSLLRPGATGLWVNVMNDAQGRFGRVLLSIERVQREMQERSSPVPGFTPSIGHGGGSGSGAGGGKSSTLKVNACQAYDYLLLASLKAQLCDERRLEVTDEWAWLLHAFAGQYGVRSNHALMSHLRWVLKPGVASVSRHCFDLLASKLRPLLEQEGLAGALTGQEATMLGKIKRDIEELLKLAFENYYLLSSSARKGILEGGMHPSSDEFPPEALVAGMRLYEAMHDVFAPSDADWLGDRFRLAAKTRWQRLVTACEAGSVGGLEQVPTVSPLHSAPLSQHLPLTKAAGASPASAGSKAPMLYSRMAALGSAIINDLEYDLRLQSVPRLLPSTLCLPAISAAEFCTNYVALLRGVLSQAPPHQPTGPAIDLLVGVAGLQRYLEERGLVLPRNHPGCIDAVELFGHHVHSWITNSQEMLCSTCASLEATTELSAVSAAPTHPALPLGSSEEGGVAPIAHEMLRHIVNEMHRYERVVMHWPVFAPYMEAALCVVLRVVVSAVSRQCGMTSVRPGAAPGGGAGAGVGAGGDGSACKGRKPGAHGSPGAAYLSVDSTHSSPARTPRAFSGAPQWAWQAGMDSPRRAGTASGWRPILLMVREAVLLNSLKRLMVAVPNYEGTLTRWGGGAAAGGGGGGGSAAAAAAAGGGDNDVAPHVGAQFAQVVKELRSQYASAVASTAERMSAGLAASSATSVQAVLGAAAAKAAMAGSAQQQASLVEGAAEALFAALDEALGALREALDPRVFVAMVRALWDYVGRALFEYVEQLQEGAGHRGAWRSRQTASVLLGLLNSFFRAQLLGHMEHTLQERDLAVPLHVDASEKLLAQSTAALNNSYTPF